MKLAIIGSGPIALEAALQFHGLDAALTWYYGDPYPLDELAQDWNQTTSNEGQKLTGNLPLEFSWEAWKKNYRDPLIEVLKQNGQQAKPYQVLSVTKRYLAPHETLVGSTRFADLFRIIYQLNPEQFINEQKQLNPETFQRLTDELVKSLQSSLELYEDFDLVLDLREPFLASSVAISGRALGEGRVTEDKLFRGYEALKNAASLPATPELREICLVGSGRLAVEILLRLENWLKDERSRLFVVSHEDAPFSDLRLNDLLLHHSREFQKDVDVFHEKLREWQALDDFVQAKKPRPVEPIPRLVFFSGHNVTAIDQLIDRRRVFVTVERPEFRHGKLAPENNDLDLKTIGVDLVLSANDPVKPRIADLLMEQETGYYELVPKSWKEDLHALDAIKKSIFTLFSPVPAAH
jgi:hypothetical protein